MDQITGLSFEEELYSAISMLSFWEEGKAVATKGGVSFEMENISAVEEFRALGMVSLDVREEERPVEFLTLGLILAVDMEPENAEAAIPALHDVNLAFKEGLFYIDEDRNLCYEANFPVLRGDLEGSLKLFIAAYDETRTFIDGVFPFLLRLAARPQDADFREYLLTMLGE